MALPVHLRGISGAFYRTSELCAAGIDQHREYGCVDFVDVAPDTALAAGIDVSRLPGIGLCYRAFAVFCAFGPVVREWLARPALHRGPLGGLVNLGGWQFAAQGGGLIAGQADRYLLGAFLAPQFVGYYTIAQRLEEAMYIGVLKIGEILFPFFSSLHKESTERIADLLFRSSWVLNLLAATLLGALIPVAGPLLYAWTGKEVAVETEGLLVVLAVAGMLGCASNVFAYYLLAMAGRAPMP